MTDTLPYSQWAELNWSTCVCSVLRTNPEWIGCALSVTGFGLKNPPLHRFLFSPQGCLRVHGVWE